ncbi:hypothetical protein WA026_005733 [Henosepilachna vigintioctopunctata]|uniref:Major facilitator superfamily (MFS) profile domain-containing protein n=1 Tax=Henosepilachna vigintioctopunctata TaxID=420089 RepID=A0AAW1TTQ4_9CUCU
MNSTADNPLNRILTDNEVSWLSSVPCLGSIAGSFLFGFISPTIGKKSVITLMGLSYVLFFIIMLCSRVYWLHITARFLSGVGSGGVLLHLPVYIYELALPDMRKSLMALMYASLNIGMLITFCTVSRTSFYEYHLVFSTLPMIFVILFTKLGTESPYSIATKDVYKAEQILRELRAKYDVAHELQEIIMYRMETSSVGMVDLFIAQSTRTSFAIVLGLSICVTSSGALAILSYIHFILRSAGGSWPAESITVVLGIVQLVTTVVSSNVAERIGQKQLLSISYSISSLSQALLGIYFLMKDVGVVTSRIFGWIPLASLILYITAYTLQVTLTGLISVDILPRRIKNLANSVCSVYTALFGFLIIFYFETLQESIGLGQCFLVFSVFGFFASVFVGVVLVETEAKRLDPSQCQLNATLDNSSNKLEGTEYGTIDKV